MKVFAIFTLLFTVAYALSGYPNSGTFDDAVNVLYTAADPMDCAMIREALSGRFVNLKGDEMLIKVNGTELSGIIREGDAVADVMVALVCTGPFEFGVAHTEYGVKQDVFDQGWVGVPLEPARWIRLSGCDDIWGEEVLESDNAFVKQ